MSEVVDVRVISATCEQNVYAPYDVLHGTPNTMFLRRVIIETPQGRATLEQSDYGHPGRMNPWQPRGVDQRLLPRLGQLTAVAEALGELQH